MKNLKYIANLLKFAFEANPLLYASVLLSLFSVVVELLAMSSLMPLFQLVSGGAPATTGIIARLIVSLDFDVTAASLLWTFIALIVLRLLTQLGSQSLSMYLSKRVLAQLGSRAFDRIVHALSIREINDKSIGFYIGMAGDESFRASMLIISITQFVSTGMLALMYFSAIYIASKPVSMALVVFIFASAFVMLFVLKASYSLGARQTTEQRKATSVFLDTLNNLKAVRAYSSESYVVRMYREVIFAYTRVLYLLDEIALLARVLPVILLLGVFSAWLVLSGNGLEKAGLPFLVTMIVYMMRFLPTLGDTATLLFKIVSDARSGHDVTTLLDSGRTQDLATAASGTTLHATLDRIQNVRFSSVGFSYDSQRKHAVLDNVSLEFRRGRSYALVGKSGTGKSTLIDLLLGFHSPTAGSLTLNDLPISNFDERDIRRRIVLVNQDVAIFDDSIDNNIRLGMAASEEALQDACERSHLQEVIAQMPQGRATRLQYQGRNLSGGQRQRIAIARGLLRDPDVLVLDESTSALDKDTQTQVVEGILKAYADRIVVFVTHDPVIMSRVHEIIDLQKLNEATWPPEGDS